MSSSSRYSTADQPARFAKAKADNNTRYLDIDSVYDGSFLKGKRVAITGANRGSGLELSKAVAAAGGEVVAIVRSTSDELQALQPKDLVAGVDFTDNQAGAKIVDGIKGGPIDIVRALQGSVGCTSHWIHDLVLSDTSCHLFFDCCYTAYQQCRIFHARRGNLDKSQL